MRARSPESPGSGDEAMRWGPPGLESRCAGDFPARGPSSTIPRVIPLRDRNPSGSVPVVTIALIIVNALIFLYEVSLGPAVRELLSDHGLVPARIAYALRYGEGGGGA